MFLEWVEGYSVLVAPLVYCRLASVEVSVDFVVRSRCCVRLEGGEVVSVLCLVKVERRGGVFYVFEKMFQRSGPSTVP